MDVVPNLVFWYRPTTATQTAGPIRECHLCPSLPLRPQRDGAEDFFQSPALGSGDLPQAAAVLALGLDTALIFSPFRVQELKLEEQQCQLDQELRRYMNMEGKRRVPSSRPC